MAQLFKPSSNTMARASALAMGIAPVAVFYLGSTISRGPFNTKEEVAINQPVPFSHHHHAFELGIDCRYCHTSVEKSRTASIPPTETCMTCHSQIWTNSPLLEPVRKSYETGMPITWDTGEIGWNRVNKLPEFVYFDHSIHIKRGINCLVCHGAVLNMPITWKGHAFSMAWCLDCHREPERFVRKDPDHPNDTPTQAIFDLIRDVQAGKQLSEEKQVVVDGGNMNPTPDEKEENEKLVEQLHIKKAQLTDCWICHR